MSVKAIVTIELDGVKHELNMDDARDLWISLGNVLNPIKKETPKDPAPYYQGIPPSNWGWLSSSKRRALLNPTERKKSLIKPC
jgi:hypothetical protein